MNPTILGISLLTIADASSFWSANNPSFFTVRTFTTKGDQQAEHARTDIYAGGAKATVETVAIGFGGAFVTKSWWPLAIPLAYMGICWAWYKWALDNPHPTAEPMADQTANVAQVSHEHSYQY